MQTLASGLLRAHSGNTFVLDFVAANFVFAMILKLSKATVSYHAVQSPSMLMLESADNTCIISHLVGARQSGVRVFCESMSHPDVSNRGSVKVVVDPEPAEVCNFCVANNVPILYASLIPFVTGPIH